MTRGKWHVLNSRQGCSDVPGLAEVADDACKLFVQVLDHACRPPPTSPGTLFDVREWNQGSPAEYTFKLDHPEWVDYLECNGFCILEGILPEGDVAHIESLFWEEISQVVPQLQRDDPETWNFPGNPAIGIVRGFGLPQSKFAWAVGCHQSLHQVFSQIVKAGDLVVSTDSVKLVGH